MASNIALLCWKMLVYVFPPAVLETFPCSVFIPRLNILFLLSSPMRYKYVVLLKLLLEVRFAIVKVHRRDPAIRTLHIFRYLH